MQRQLPDDLSASTQQKWEAIHYEDRFEDVIAELNRAFHDSYDLMIHETYENLGKRETPVIVVLGDKVVLFHDSEREIVEIIPDLYHRMKAISHVSFGVYTILVINGYGILKEKHREDLENKRDLIEKALSIGDLEPIPANCLKLQIMTLENALAIVEEVLASGVVESSRLQAFARENAPIYLENAALTAMLKLEPLHRTIMRWKGEIGDEDWGAIYVVVCSSHQARYRETTLQYFQKLLHQDEGRGAEMEDRIVYGEHKGEGDVDVALDLLARHIFDQKASLDLFNDRSRMQQDLMSDGAAAFLKELFPN